jgi:phage terminase small subunit
MTDRTQNEKWRPEWKPRKAKKSPTTGQRAPKALNAKQRAWIDAHVKGMSDKDAALAAGYSEATARTHAYRLRHHPLVKAELAKIEERLRERTAYDCAAAFAEQGRLMELAIEAGQLNAAVKASEARARLHGLLIDRSKQEIAFANTPDLRQALEDARGRVVDVQVPALPNLRAVRPMRDLAPPVDAEFRDVSNTCGAGPSDNESLTESRRAQPPDMDA